MNQLLYLNKIVVLLSRFSEQVKLFNANSEFSINVHAENILIKILNVIYDCDLKNVNYEENKNYPSIDLRDENKRIAIQVTSTSGLEKVKHTLSQFITNNLYTDFDQLYIYIITEKKDKYNQEIINRITEGKFDFPSDHIIDKNDLYLMLNKQNDFKKIKDVFELLEQQFSDNPSDNEKELDKWEKYFKGLSEYDQYISRLYKHIEIKGFSPKINNTTVQLDIDKIYVPLKFKYDFSSNNDKRKYTGEGEYSITSALENFNRIVILGDPGSGKSTTLKYLAYNICANRATHYQFGSYIPIYIRAAEFANYYSDTGRSLSEYIIDINKMYGFLFSNSLENNRLIVLFDGLDEINITNLRHRIVEKLNSFIAQYPQIKIVVSSRIVGYFETRLSSDFFHFEVDKFSDKQILEFLNNWFASIYIDNTQKALDEATNLYYSIRKNNSVYKLACNPLLVTIIALIYYQGIKLPDKRVSLYDIATSTLLENWVQLRATNKNNIQRETLIELLASVSFYIHENYSTGLIPEKELRQLLTKEYYSINSQLPPKEAKKDIDDIISFLREDAGFLFEKGRNENGEALFGFVHLSFQEYFAAIEFKTRWKEGTLKRILNKYISDSRWAEVIILTASLFRLHEPGRLGRKDTTEFIIDLYNIKEIIPEMNRRQIIICQILKDDIEIEFDAYKRIVDGILKDLLFVSGKNKDNIDVKFEYIWRVSLLLNNTYYQEYLLKRLLKNIVSSPTSNYSRSLIWTLMEASDNPAVKAKLISILESDRTEVKICMFDYPVISDPSLGILSTEKFRSEIVNYINSPAYSKIYNGHLPIQYICCFSFNSEDNQIEEWLLSIRLLTNLKMKKDLIDFYVFSWGMSDVTDIRKYYEAVKKEYPNFELSKIKKYIDKLDFINSSGIDKIPIVTFDDIHIHRLRDNESKFAIIHNEEITFVEYPFNYDSIKPFFDSETSSIIIFLNIIVLADRSESKEIIIHNDTELNSFIKYADTIYWYAELKQNKAISYALSALFTDGVVHENLLYGLRSLLMQRFSPIIIESSFNHRSFERQVKASSLKTFDKLLLLKTIKPEFEDKELISKAIKEYNEEKSKAIKAEYLRILQRII